MKRKTHEEYVTEVAKLYPNIEVVGKYVGSYIKIMHKCKIDGYIWRPDQILFYWDMGVRNVLDELLCHMTNM